VRPSAAAQDAAPRGLHLARAVCRVVGVGEGYSKKGKDKRHLGTKKSEPTHASRSYADARNAIQGEQSHSDGNNPEKKTTTLSSNRAPWCVSAGCPRFRGPVQCKTRHGSRLEKRSQRNKKRTRTRAVM
jgi:hypothetical protein